MQTVIIVGGGISGLHTAYELAKQGVKFKLLEARSRLGGRILSRPSERDRLTTSRYDLGPSWFWPGQNRDRIINSRTRLKAQCICAICRRR